MRHLSAGVAVALCLVLLVGCYSKSAGYVELSPVKKATLLSVTNDDDPNSKNNFVSIAKVASDKFILSNYVSLLAFDRKNGMVCKLEVDNKSLAQAQSFSNGGAVYNPAGVVAGSDGRVYVANYKANNILVGRADVTGCTFTVESVYSSADTLGPESVAVDEHSGLLVSANYDAGNVVAFDLKSKRQLWVAAIPQAHGITFSKGRIFATGLTERKVYELDAASGKILQSKGSIGWNPMAAQYLWPTSVAAASNGELVVADPQSGFVSMLNEDNLDVKRYTGGNGPATTLFNYPYTALFDGGELIVLSSMRGEIVFLNPNDMTVTERSGFSRKIWPVTRGADDVFGRSWNDYADSSQARVTIAGNSYRLGFGNLHAADSDIAFRVPNSGGLFDPGSYLYFLQSYSGASADLIFSSSSTTLFGIAHRSGYPDVLLPKLISQDSWAVDGTLYSGERQGQSLDDLAKGIVERGNAYYEKLDEQGWMDQASVYSLLGFSALGVKYEAFLSRLDLVFSSAAGRVFKAHYDHCESGGCDKANLKKAAAVYFEEIAVEKSVALDEYLLVGMLAGVSATTSQQTAIEFDNCMGGRYYAGYDLNALRTPGLEDYLSSTDLSGSTLCFTVSDSAVANGIAVIWNDEQTASKTIEVSAETQAGDWVVLGRYSDFAVAKVDGYAVSEFRFENKENYSRFLLKTIDGGVQKRLLLRQVRPLINETDE